MALLSLLNALPHYKNFSKRMTPGDYIRWGALTHLNIDIATSTKKQAIKNNRIGMAFWIQIAIVLRIISSLLVETSKKLLPDKSLYRLKRCIYEPETELGSTKQ